MTPVEAVTWAFVLIVVGVVVFYIYIVMVRPFLASGSRRVQPSPSPNAQGVISSLVEEKTGLDKCVYSALDFVKRNFENLKKKGVPMVAIEVGENGEILHVNVAVASHGDIIEEYIICSGLEKDLGKINNY